MQSLYPLSHLSASTHTLTTSARPSLAFSTLPSTQKYPFQSPPQKYSSPSSATSNSTPSPMIPPNVTSPILSRSPGHPMPHPPPLSPYLSLHTLASPRCSPSRPPMPYIHSRVTCKHYPWITTHFFIFGIAAHQQPLHTSLDPLVKPPKDPSS